MFELIRGMNVAQKGRKEREKKTKNVILALKFVYSDL
jgi:hypothetical protein